MSADGTFSARDALWHPSEDASDEQHEPPGEGYCEHCEALLDDEDGLRDLCVPCQAKFITWRRESEAMAPKQRIEEATDDLPF